MWLHTYRNFLPLNIEPSRALIACAAAASSTKVTNPYDKVFPVLLFLFILTSKNINWINLALDILCVIWIVESEFKQVTFPNKQNNYIISFAKISTWLLSWLV